MALKQAGLPQQVLQLLQSQQQPMELEVVEQNLVKLVWRKSQRTVLKVLLLMVWSAFPWEHGSQPLECEDGLKRDSSDRVRAAI